MSEQNFIVCDECGDCYQGRAWLAVMDTFAPKAPVFSVRPLRDVMLAPALYEIFSTHICGADCLARRQSKWLAAISSPAVTQTETNHDNPDGNDGDAPTRV